MARDGIAKWGKVLSLAVAAGNQHNRATQSFKRCDGRTDVGPLGIVVEDHAVVAVADRCHAMRQTGKPCQRIEHGLQRTTDCLPQRKRCKGIAGIVKTGESHAARRKQRFIATSKPRAVIPLHDTVIAGPDRRIRSEGDVSAPRQRHRHDTVILAVQYLGPFALEDARLDARVVADVAVPVEMVVGDIEDGGRQWIQAIHALELEARKLEHPAFRERLIAVEAVAQHG